MEVEDKKELKINTWEEIDSQLTGVGQLSELSDVSEVFYEEDIFFEII